MTYKVKYHEQVFKVDKLKLSKESQRRIEKVIREKIQKQPEQFGKPLRKSLKGHWKTRVGEYRIIFKVKGDTVFVLKIGHRSTVYKKLLKRLRSIQY